MENITNNKQHKCKKNLHVPILELVTCSKAGCSKAGCPNSVLEGQCPAEFSSNLPQNTCLKVSSMLRLAISGVFDKGWS